MLVAKEFDMFTFDGDLCFQSGFGIIAQVAGGVADWELVVWVPIFLVLWAVILCVIKQVDLVGKNWVHVFSASMALLSVTGMRRSLGSSMEMLLIPYAALGISILLVGLLMLWMRIRGKRMRQREKKRFRD